MDFKAIQDKWQKKWKQSKLFEVEIDKKKRNSSLQCPYPYISGSFAHKHTKGRDRS